MGLQIICIALGSALGGVSRFGLAKILNPLFTQFPLGTFLVNVLGCFILGFIASLASKTGFPPTEIKNTFTIGFCGSFTTFSTLLYESTLIGQQEKLYAFLYVALSLLVGLIALFFADWLVEKFVA